MADGDTTLNLNYGKSSWINCPSWPGGAIASLALTTRRTCGLQRLAVNLEAVSRLAREPWAGLEQMPHHIRCDERHHSVLQRDGPHVRSLVAVHSCFSAEFAGANPRDFTYLAITDHLQRDLTGYDEVHPFQVVALIEEPFSGAEGQRPRLSTVIAKSLSRFSRVIYPKRS